MDSSFELDARKTFFIFHLPETENKVIKRIVSHEYEAYSLPSNVESCIQLLQKYNNSIVFVAGSNCPRNINWEQSFHKLVSTCCSGDLKISTWHTQAGSLVLNKRLTNFETPFEYVNIDEGIDVAVPHILDFLKSLNARGRRKYIRARCDDTYSATFSIKFNKNIFNGIIHDISSYGMACSFSSDIGLEIHMYLHDIQLRLNGIGSAVAGTVFGKREMDGTQIFVIVFDFDRNPLTKTRIHDFIYSFLQKKLKNYL